MKLNFPLIIFSSVFIALLIACEKLPEEKKTITAAPKDTQAVKTLDHFLFVGKWHGKNGIYKYDMLKRKYETQWWHPRENVTLLVTKPGAEPAFFLTGGKMGVKGDFPFFERIKIYRISGDLSGTENIYKIESGMQLTSRWNDDGNLEVVFTAVDKTDPSYINKHKKTFDSYGKLIDDEIETFNIEVDGFPELLPKRNPTVSHSGNYGISVIGDSVFFKTAGSDSLKLITTIKHSLNKINWSDDEYFLFISTLDLENESLRVRNPETSELFIYSTAYDSVTASWDGAGIKNFFTFDSLIVFDNGFGKNSSVNVYNFYTTEMIDEIRLQGGCGLIYLPEIKP